MDALIEEEEEEEIYLSSLCGTKFLETEGMNEFNFVLRKDKNEELNAIETMDRKEEEEEEDEVENVPELQKVQQQHQRQQQDMQQKQQKQETLQIKSNLPFGIQSHNTSLLEQNKNLIHHDDQDNCYQEDPKQENEHNNRNFVSEEEEDWMMSSEGTNNQTNVDTEVAKISSKTCHASKNSVKLPILPNLSTRPVMPTLSSIPTIPSIPKLSTLEENTFDDNECTRTMHESWLVDHSKNWFLGSGLNDDHFRSTSRNRQSRSNKHNSQDNPSNQNNHKTTHHHLRYDNENLNPGSTLDGEDNCFCYDRDFARWNEFERATRIRNLRAIFLKIRQSFPHSWRVRFYRCCAVYCWTFGLDAAMTVAIGVYWLALIAAAVWTTFPPVTRKKDSSIFWHYRMRIVAAVGVIFAWFFARTLITMRGIQTNTIPAASSACSEGSTTVTASTSQTSTTPKTPRSTKRWTLRIAGCIMSLVTAAMYVLLGLIHSCILLQWWGISRKYFDDDNTYFGTFIHKHHDLFLVSSPVAERYILPYLTLTKYLPHVWLMLAIATTVELCRCHVHSKYRQFLCYGDEILTVLQQPDQRPQQDHQQHNNQQHQRPQFNANNYIFEHAWRDDTDTTHQYLQEPLLGYGDASTTAASTSTMSGEIRYGIPAWVMEPNSKCVSNRGYNRNTFDNDGGSSSALDPSTIMANATIVDSDNFWHHPEQSMDSQHHSDLLSPHLHPSHNDSTRRQQRRRPNHKKSKKSSFKLLFRWLTPCGKRRRQRKRRRRQRQRQELERATGVFSYTEEDFNDYYDDGEYSDDNDEQSEEINFASIQEEWANLSQDDPFWWSRDDHEQQRQPVTNTCTKKTGNQQDPDWVVPSP